MTREELKVLASAFRAELLGIEILRAEKELALIYGTRIDVLKNKIEEYKRLQAKAQSRAHLSKGSGGQFDGR